VPLERVSIALLKTIETAIDHREGSLGGSFRALAQTFATWKVGIARPRVRGLSE
jgi:type IV secretory pathway TrbL component